MSFYSIEELNALGFSSVGKNVFVSKKASIYGIEYISVGDNVRIDDFCVLSAGKSGIKIGSFIHIAVYSSLIGQGEITLENFCNISSRVSIYSSSDDYSGGFMTNPMVPDKYTNVTHAPVVLKKHTIIGSGSVILPRVNIGEGVAVGALSLVNKDLDPWGVYAGQPARFIKERLKGVIEKESHLMKK